MHVYMLKAYKFRLNPTKDQKVLIEALKLGL